MRFLPQMSQYGISSFSKEPLVSYPTFLSIMSFVHSRAVNGKATANASIQYIPVRVHPIIEKLLAFGPLPSETRKTAAFTLESANYCWQRFTWNQACQNWDFSYIQIAAEQAVRIGKICRA